MVAAIRGITLHGKPGQSGGASPVAARATTMGSKKRSFSGKMLTIASDLDLSAGASGVLSAAAEQIELFTAHDVSRIEDDLFLGGRV